MIFFYIIYFQYNLNIYLFFYHLLEKQLIKFQFEEINITQNEISTLTTKGFNFTGNYNNLIPITINPVIIIDDSVELPNGFELAFFNKKNNSLLHKSLKLLELQFNIGTKTKKPKKTHRQSIKNQKKSRSSTTKRTRTTRPTRPTRITRDRKKIISAARSKKTSTSSTPSKTTKSKSTKTTKSKSKSKTLSTIKEEGTLTTLWKTFKSKFF